MSGQAQAIIQVDNAQVRITKWQFAPGAATGYHRHAYDYVVVPLTTGKLKLIGPDGNETMAELTAGNSYFRKAGVEHDVINANAYEFAFVEIEWKEQGSGLRVP
jgi:quercetin dioxygenase-like cupin family protein